MSEELSVRLLALVEAEAKSPEGRSRLLHCLCESIARASGHEVLICSAAEAAGLRAAAAAISEHLTFAADHADFLGDFMTRMPPPG